MQEKYIDMTAFGLFFVALVSLPIALNDFVGYSDSSYGLDGTDLAMFAKLCGFFIMLAAIGCYLSRAHFGTVVFGLVSAGVLFSGFAGGVLYTNLALGIIYLVALVWSYLAKNTPVLTTILLTTALIFIFGGVAAAEGQDFWVLMQGIAAIANFALALYLAFSLVKAECDGTCSE